MPRLPGAGSLKLLSSVTSSLRPTTTTTLIATCSLSTTQVQHQATSWVREKLWRGKTPGTEDPYTESPLPRVEEVAAETAKFERPPRRERIPLPIRKSRLTVPPRRTEAATEAAAAESDPSYVPAEDGQGLEEIDTLANWWDRPGHWGEESKFKGFAGRTIITKNAVIEASLARAFIEAFSLQQTGHFNEWLAKPWNPGGRADLKRILKTSLDTFGESQSIAMASEISAATRDQAGKEASVLTEKEAQAAIKRWGSSWKRFAVGDKMKFALRKRFFQLTGILVPDAKLESVNTMNDFCKVVTRPEKPKRLATELRERGDLSKLPNVTIHSRRVGLITRETAVGRWKVIQEELRKREPAVPGPNVKSLEKMESPHTALAYSQWDALNRVRSSRRPVVVDGQSLSVADVAAVCGYGARAVLTDDSGVLAGVKRSVTVLDHHLQHGKTVYGVNTGFGNSADVRTADLVRLQSSLVQFLNVGILIPSDKGQDVDGANLPSHAMPEAIVRGMLLVRCNSLMRGHSGVRLGVVRAMMALLEAGVTPVVPLRGSISACGDLPSLSYIAGTLEGNPDIYVRMRAGGSSTVVTADEALRLIGLEPLQLQNKETIGIVNGTAGSAAAACVAVHEAHRLALLTQMLTATATEALLGSSESFSPFISLCRPHIGQREAAANMTAFLFGSSLVSAHAPKETKLAQDRYALRTAPQWIGPLLENLILADEQVRTELNSTTDNPVINSDTQTIHHGGNFQAAAVTSAMEKVSSSMQLLGRLMFAQYSELLDSSANKHLPPNLAVDEPSTSFTMKGAEISMAAYMSELAYIAHPVSTHVQSAEMNNQSVNSLALIAARVALEAIEVLSHMAATLLQALCQALDLRCLQMEFEEAAEKAVRALLPECLATTNCIDAIHTEVWPKLLWGWRSRCRMDNAERGPAAAREASSALIQALGRHRQALAGESAQDVLDAVERFCAAVGRKLSDTYARKRVSFLDKPTTPAYLGAGSRLLYGFVREKLGIPMHRGLVDHPTVARGRRCKTLGNLASDIYVSLRDGRLYEEMMKAVVVAAGEENLATMTIDLTVD
ncbi:hypothetical protein CP532_3348 [Ophiocordyceps camponoti-leonardi (nom. inval.)]|nr:hypothetical protein CP532_3348 [Ophiocordyceps camponoti-leonardi (nom. inval.)]